MSALRLRAPPIGRSPVALVLALLALAGVGWAVAGHRMSGMDAGPGTDAGALAFFLTTWVVMMSAMMFPSAAPMVVVYDRLRVRRRQLGKSAPAAGTPLFVGGYLISWAGF